MAENLLVRNLSNKVDKWIEKERYQHKMTKQEFVYRVLENVSEYGQGNLFNEIPPAAQPSPGSLPFTFIDLFAGIGGFRLGLQKVGGRCVFSSEWDTHAQKTYRAWFGETPVGGVSKPKPSDVPDYKAVPFRV